MSRSSRALFSRAFSDRPDTAPAARRRMLTTLLVATAMLATAALCMACWSLIQQASLPALPLTAAALTPMELLLACAGSMLCGGALVYGVTAASTLRHHASSPEASQVQPGPSDRARTAHAPAEGGAAHGVSFPEPAGWTSLWPAAPEARPAPAASATTAGSAADPAQARDTEPPAEPACPAFEPDDLLHALRQNHNQVRTMTSTSRALSREADELGACSLDLSSLANGTLRSVTAADTAARSALLEVSTALLSATLQLATERTGSHEVRNCLVHARATHQLVQQFLALAGRPAGTPSTGAGGRQEASEWRDAEPDLARLADECLQAADRTAELAANSQAHFKAAEVALRARVQALEALASELQDMSTISATVLRMTTSQVDYGNNIAHLAGRLAMGASCLNNDLERAFGDQ